ncbi:reverse transcriptase [Gossypium australe]|uniref:Reverse transcriptase n=1 Tax=Gossypium australe TaxID=47621 RepID=A0A5B6VU90_9ROSI|nr:reverse transcriptase [Gossypium australe]
MGFGAKWRGWIMECVSTARAAMLERTQTGDPLSPFLLILVTEVLHLMLVKAEEIGTISGIQNIIANQSFSHLQFADNTNLFLRAEEYVKNIKYILRCFEISSSLSINFKKLCLVGFGTDEEFLLRMAALCRCKIRDLPFNYLGIPLRADPRKIATWDSIAERFCKKLSRWKCQSLPFAARIVLVNSILSALPIYFMSLFQASSIVIKNIDKIIRNILWGGAKDGKSKLEVGLFAEREGGVGVVNLKIKNRALMAKWSWRFTTEKNALWRKVIQVKYGSLPLQWRFRTSNLKEMSILWRRIVENSKTANVAKWVRNESFRWLIGNGKLVLFWEDFGVVIIL